MEFQVKIAGFLSGIKPVFEVATKGAVKEFDGVNKINISAEKDSIELSSFNGRMSIKNKLSDLSLSDLDYKLTTNGTTTVNVKDLLNVLDSFNPTETIVVNLNTSTDGKTKELVFTQKNDKEQFQSLPCYDAVVSLPQVATKFEKEIEIDKNIFISSNKKVFFAVGFEQHREQYLYWVLRTDKGKARFVAGSGGRFAILELDGKDIVSNIGKAVDMLFPKESTPILNNVLSYIDAERITIKQSDPSATDGSPYQILISSDDVEVCLVAMNPDIKWINENDFISAVYNTKLITKVSELEYAGKGVVATFSEEMRKEHHPHKATVEVDSTKKYIAVKTNNVMKSLRKVSIIDDKSTVPTQGNFTFNCASVYLNELANYATDKNGYIQIETNKDIDPSNRFTKVVVIRYYATDKVVDKASDLKTTNDALGLSESFTIFFSKLVD